MAQISNTYGPFTLLTDSSVVSQQESVLLSTQPPILQRELNNIGLTIKCKLLLLGCVGLGKTLVENFTLFLTQLEQSIMGQLGNVETFRMLDLGEVLILRIDQRWLAYI